MVVREADNLREQFRENDRVIVVEPISFLYTAYADRILKKYLDENIVYKAIYESIVFSVNNSDGINTYF